MTNTAQHWAWTSEVGLRAAGGALALAVALVAAVVATRPAQAQTFTVLYAFTGGADGATPTDLMLDAKGNLYGTTVYGGSSNFPNGYGVVFKVDRTNKEPVLYSFTGPPDGANPDRGGVVRDAAGNLYGTTLAGGASGYYGTVFKLDNTGKESVLYSFTGGADGGEPFAGVVRDAKGNLYGTTTYGGDLTCDAPYGCGVVFKVDTTGTETVLHTFTGSGGDGGNPVAGLVRDAAGNLYGTTRWYGASGDGTVFNVDRTGKETVLYSFTGGDGSTPYAGLVRDAAGNLYGTTLDGGGSGYGTVFKLDKSGKETVLHSFAGPPADGAYPFAGLVRDAKGNLYGTTGSGGPFDWGTVFKLDKTGKESVLHSFTGAADGGSPWSGLVRDARGNLYGTTSQGGSTGCEGSGCGVVFKLTP
jgi:uncharacterized repeat protein (TIGR03803 family)